MKTEGNINIFWARVFVEELARSGVRDVVISPGSRSTPLVLAFAAHPDIEDHSVIDERSAAFHALGIAKASRRPVALLCTSGTAGANYFPAVCEADASRVPLLVCTADRPHHARDSGAAQSMDQLKLYGNHVRYFHDVAQPEADEEKLRALRSIACLAVAVSTGERPGPVHLNFPFRKPLEPTPATRLTDMIPESWSSSRSETLDGRRDGRPWTVYSQLVGTPVQRMDRFRLVDMMLRSQRPLIIAGPHPSAPGLREAAAYLTTRHRIPAFVEATSNLRYGAQYPLFYGTSDLLLRSRRFRTWLQPDFVLQLGAAPTNSTLLTFFDELDDVPFVVLASSLDRADPSHRATHHIIAEPVALFSSLDEEMSRYPMANRDSGWLEGIARADEAARAELRSELSVVAPFLEGAAVARMAALMPNQGAIMLSSSMPIRDTETFLPICEKETEVLFNRGVNGIDGIVSTALGVARERPCVLIVGDIAVLHNLNALAGEGLSALPLVILLLNNKGGEIFELLPIRQYEPEFTKHFLTPHAIDIGSALTACGARFVCPTDWEAFDEAMRAAFWHNGVSVVQVCTDIIASGVLRRGLLHRIAEAVDAATGTPAIDESAVRMPYPLAWYDHGGEGVPAVLLHGFTRSASSWESLRAHADGRRFISVDLMGHGGSPAPEWSPDEEAWSLQGTARRLDETLRLLGIDRIHLCGYSMGGREALAFALAYPGRIASVALISANPGIADDVVRRNRVHMDEQLADSIERKGLHRFVREWGATPLFAKQADTHPAQWRSAQLERRSNRAAALSASLRGSGQGSQLSMWDGIAELSFPVLAVAGMLDPAYTAIAERIGAEAHARVVILDQCGHDVLTEAPEALAKELHKFWKHAEQ